MAKSNSGVGRLLAAMKRHIKEVNDQEICRRLEILMGSEKADLPQAMVRPMLEEPGGFDPKRVPEPYTQYVKHYLYMVKRAARESAKAVSPTGAKSARSGRTPSARPRKPAAVADRTA